MNASLFASPTYAKLRQAVAELSMISHTSGVSYDGKVARDTSESIGGKRPSGSDMEYRPRAPKSPRVEGDLKSEKAWDEFEEELDAWEVCYHRRTPAYFARELERCKSEYRLKCLLTEAEDALEAWKHMPIPSGNPPKPGDAQFKRWVAESSLTNGEIARLFFISRQYVHKIRKGYAARDDA